MTWPQKQRTQPVEGWVRDRTYERNPSTITASPLQHFHDLSRERRIRCLSARFLEAYRAGDKVTARHLDAARIAEILGRSPRQVERMEACMGVTRRARRGQ